jgi:hypothetical protein
MPPTADPSCDMAGTAYCRCPPPCGPAHCQTAALTAAAMATDSLGDDSADTGCCCRLTLDYPAARTEAMQTTDVVPAVFGNVLAAQESDPLRRAVAAYLSRFKGRSRIHSESDLRAFLSWGEDHDFPPLQASRPHLELYLRWMQEVLASSPADYVRRPNVPPESPTLGLTHLQFEAMLTTAGRSC